MSENCRLILGDCLEKMKEMPDNSVDLVLTDPPYGINQNKMNMGNGGGVAKNNQYLKFDDSKKPDLTECFRISRNQVIFGGNYFHLPPTPCWLVWDKIKDGRSTDFADCELAWTSFKSPVRKFTFLWRGMLQGNMRHKENKLHPTQKPLALMEWIIKNYSKEGELIFDPFMGSGTTGIATLKLQRRFIGIEINPEYFEITKKRIGEWENQSRLFENAGEWK